MQLIRRVPQSVLPPVQPVQRIGANLDATRPHHAKTMIEWFGATECFDIAQLRQCRLAANVFGQIDPARFATSKAQ